MQDIIVNYLIPDIDHNQKGSPMKNFAYSHSPSDSTTRYPSLSFCRTIFPFLGRIRKCRGLIGGKRY
jgi:hypothetical protein